ncbi:MAG: hypothetical protein HOE19_04225 [Candidatus Komeilibacteria bacterium]|jgi:hypothetical protein|nr:hypothetical protein [Candidatus Komeilibacteria bacterium]MBT4447881.1 hypothetical protein [Candidatus Komeilibacteria bacterium]
MDISTLILLFVCIVNVILLVFIFFNKDKERSWPFFWILLLLVLWQVTELFNVAWLMYQDKELLLIGVQAGLLPALYLAPAFIRLVFSLFGKCDEISKIKKTLYLLPAIIMSGFVFTPYNVSQVIVSGNRFFYVAGPVYWFFATYFVLLMSYGLYTLARNRRTSGVIVSRQITYIFIGTTLAALGGLTFNILFPIWGLHNLYYLGVNSTVFFSIILTYALFRYEFFDLKASLYKSLISLFKLFTTGLIYYIFYILFHDLIKVDFNNIHNVIFLLLVLGLSAPFVFNAMNRVALALFINPDNDFKRSTDKIVNILRSSRDLDVLLVKLSKEISKVIEYKEIFIYLSKKSDLNVFYQVFPVGERLFNKSDSDLIKHLASHKKMVNRAELDYFFTNKMLLQEMDELNVDTALPIFYNKQLLGLLMIDNDNKLFSIQELNFLKDLNKYLDIAVGSLLLHQQDLFKKK